MEADQRGRRLLPQVLDHLASTDPHGDWLSLPKHPQDASQGWYNISYATAAAAVDRAAWHVEQCLGRRSSTYETVVYLGPNDARYAYYVLGCIKAGFKALLISPRNTLEAQQSLVASTAAVAFFYAEPSSPAVDLIKGGVTIPAFAVPSETEFHSPEHHPARYRLQITKRVEDLANDPALILHTSGSTGLPRPIVVRHGALMASDAFWSLPKYRGRGTIHCLDGWGKRHFCAMPLFHAGGILQTLTSGLFWGATIVFAQSQRPLSVDVVNEVLHHADIEAMFLAPSMLADMSGDPNSIHRLRKLKYICTGGGPTSEAVADKLKAEGCFLVNLIGSTETAPISQLVPEQDDFPLFEFEESVSGIDWRPLDLGKERVYEQWIVRKDDISLQPIFYNFPEISAYNTHDLYRKHPGKPHKWSYYGRSDSLIVLSNGEKINPVDTEKELDEVPDINGSLVVGQGRFQAALLVEPRVWPPSEAERERLLELIWLAVDDANTRSATHARIQRGFLMLVAPSKPFPRAGKGTIQRAAAHSLFREEINALYQAASTAQVPEIDIASAPAIARTLSQLIAQRLRVTCEQLDDADDLFQTGIDSLQVLGIAQSLHNALAAKDVHVKAQEIIRHIYNEGTITLIARRLWELAHRQLGESGHANGIMKSGRRTDEIHNHRENDRQMADLIQTHFDAIWSLRHLRTARPPSAVILTGSTGALGPYILHNLILDPSTEQIHVLNRSDVAQARQLAQHDLHGLSTDFSKVTFHHTPTPANLFHSLDPSTIRQLQATTTRIIHNAWPVNFNIPLASFRPHLQGLASLIEFCATAPHRPALTFISSVGEVAGWDPAHGPVPEVSLPMRPHLPHAGGYAQSKHIGSAMVEHARTVLGLRAASLRCGQIAGPTTRAGAWHDAEWFPSLLRSSLYLGVLPGDLGGMGARVDWVPVDVMARLVLDIGLRDGVFHGVGPRATMWARLVPTVRAFYGARIARVAGLREWVGLVEAVAEARGAEAETARRCPAVKLLGFFQGLVEEGERQPVVLCTRRAGEVSCALRELEAVRPEWMENWMRQWDF